MRTHVIQMWSDAAEYSGEMIQRRSSESRSIYLKNGQANTALFADDESKAKPKSSIMDKIDLANRHLNRLELMSAQLEHDFDSGSITLEQYSRGRRIMDERLKKAWDRVANQEGWQDEPAEEEQQPAYAWTEKPKAQTRYQEKDSIFLTLPVDNSFRRAYTWLQKAKNLFKG